MKILSYQSGDTERLGCLWDESTILDLQRVYSEYLRSGKADGAIHLRRLPTDLLSFVQSWDKVYPATSAAVEWLREQNDPLITKLVTLSLSSVRLNAPLKNPSKVVCVGLNYRDHCREHHFAIPERPLLFSKFPTSIIGPYDEICWSKSNSQKVDYEAELAVVIKKPCRNVSPEMASEYIAGYAVLNDVSARDVQFTDTQWTRGKSFDTFCPYGPYITTPDEVVDPQNLWIRCILNDQVVQNSNTCEMVFSCYEIISFISQIATLLPGDLIATGTPDGVGSARDPQIFMHDGDTVHVEIEGLGCLENTIYEMP